MDLPSVLARRDIFAIHLRRRSQDPAVFDLDGLTQLTEGFSGSEIEQVVIAGLHTAFSANGPLTTDIIRSEVAATSPLSQTMDPRFALLRAWAEERAVPAN